MIPPVARNFVAGEEAAVALDHVRRTNVDGVGVILNRLGEHYRDRRTADADVAAYRQLVADIGGSDLDACISVKPTQLGLSVNEDAFRENYRRVVEAARSEGVFVWCDMEDATTTDATLDAFETLAREFGGGVGVCLQANLRRTHADVDHLAGAPGRIRLVKGAYDEPASIAYETRAAVNEAYRENLERLFQTSDGGVAVGSHDPEMIALARDLHAEYGTPYEVQMLMGVRERTQRELARDGVDVWQYAPYGDRWLSYFYRRVRERKENLAFALRAVTGA